MKAAATTFGSSNIAKKIRVFNTAVKRSSSANLTHGANENANGYHHGSDGRGNQSDSSRGASPPSMDIFDDKDEESLPVKTVNRNRKRKVATEVESSEEEEDIAVEKKLKKAKLNGESVSAAIRKWPTIVERTDLDTSVSHIQSTVDNHRALKRAADQALQQVPPDLSYLDHYLTASLGFFEAAALHELNARRNEGDESSANSIARAIELYRGLASSGDTPTMLTYYVGRCGQASCPLRIILGQRCLAMAYARIWSLQHKSLYSNVRSLLKRSGNEKTIQLETAKLADLNDGLRFGEYYATSEKAARDHQHVFTPFPSHPLDIDPFDFLKFIRQEHKQVEIAEPILDGKSNAASKKDGPAKKNHADSSASSSSSSSSSHSKKGSQQGSTSKRK